MTKIIEDGGLDLLIHVLKNSTNQKHIAYLTLQILAKMLLKDPTIKMQIENKGIDTSKYRNLLISIHTAEILNLFYSSHCITYLPTSSCR